MESTIKCTVGEMLNVAYDVVSHVTDTQCSRMNNWFEDLPKGKGNNSRAQILMFLTLPEYRLPIEQIVTYGDDSADMTGGQVPATTVSVPVLHLGVLGDEQIRTAFTAYLKLMSGSDVTSYIYKHRGLDVAKRFSYRHVSGVALSTDPEYSGRRQPHAGQFSFACIESPAQLAAQTQPLCDWASIMLNALTAAEIKSRFSAEALPQVKAFMAELRTLSVRANHERKGIESILITDANAKSFLSALDALDQKAEEEIRSAYVRHYMIASPYDRPFKKAKRYIKEHGTALTLDFMHVLAKCWYDDGSYSWDDLWPIVAFANFKAVGRAYINNYHLVSDDVDLEASWLQVPTHA